MNEIIPASIFLLNQVNDAPAASAEGGGATGTTASEGSPSGGAGPAQPGFFGDFNGILMIVLMFGVFYFLLIRPQQKKAKEHQKLLESIDKGSEIVTNGGLIGRVTGKTDKTFTVEISEKVRVRILRSQVAGLFNAVETPEKK